MRAEPQPQGMWVNDRYQLRAQHTLCSAVEPLGTNRPPTSVLTRYPEKGFRVCALSRSERSEQTKQEITESHSGRAPPAHGHAHVAQAHIHGHAHTGQTHIQGHAHTPGTYTRPRHIYMDTHTLTDMRTRPRHTYTDTHTHLAEHTHWDVHAHTELGTHTYTGTPAHRAEHVCTDTCTHKAMHAHWDVHTHTGLCTHMYSRAHSHTGSCTHTGLCTHSDMHTRFTGAVRAAHARQPRLRGPA